MLNRVVNLFPLWALLFSLLAYFNVDFFANLKPTIMPLLAVVMLSMGMTLSWQDFKSVLKSPLLIFIAVAIQFSMMPLFAYAISHFLALSPALMTGMVLVGSSAGGTASNVICYLAKGNVALSILMTVVSTLCAVFLMPLISYALLNHHLPVPVWGMFQSILMIVVMPVMLGTVLNSFFSRYLQGIQHYLPLLSSFSIVLIIAIIVALNQMQLSELALPVFAAVALHNALGMIAGYALPWLFNYNARECRTVCIEVAMQNSGLSVALAIKYFSTAAALPGAVFSIWHNVSGSLFVLYCRHRDFKS